MSRSARITVILLTMLACITGVFMLPPVAQDPAYHTFADSRQWLGVPNFGNVVSNFLFVVMGLFGMVAVTRHRADRKNGEYIVWMMFFLGVFLTGFGSGYYHWSPNNDTLVWDRLPMTIAFMSLSSLIVMEHIDRKVGGLLFLALLVIGTMSVWYWHYTESLGHGDLRFYGLVQFLPMIVIGLILILFPLRDSRTRYLLWTLGWYVLAKLLEHYDSQFFAISGNLISGHTLKHLAAATGIWWMIKYARKTS